MKIFVRAATSPNFQPDLDAEPTEDSSPADRHSAVIERLRAYLNREHVPDPNWPLPFADAAKTAPPPPGR